MFENDKIIPRLFIFTIMAFSLLVLAFGYLADRTFTGVVTENAYQKGLDFNKIYQTSLAHSDDAIIAEIAIIGKSVRMRLNVDVATSQIEAKLVKPVSWGFDKTITFEHTTPLSFQATLPPLDSGVWEIRVKIVHDSQDYVFNKRFVVGMK